MAEFDPFKDGGAIAVEEPSFDPFKAGAVPIDTEVPRGTKPDPEKYGSIKATPSVIGSLAKGDISGAASAAKEDVMRYFTKTEPGAGIKNLYDETVPAYHPQINPGDENARLSNLVPGLPPVSVRQAKNAVGALGDIVHGFVNPMNTALMVETGGIGTLPKVGGALSRIIAGIFAEQAGEGAIKSEIKAASLPPGSAEREAAHFETAGNVAMAGLAGAGAAKGLTGILDRVLKRSEREGWIAQNGQTPNNEETVSSPAGNGAVAEPSQVLGQGDVTPPPDAVPPAIEESVRPAIDESSAPVTEPISPTVAEGSTADAAPAEAAAATKPEPQNPIAELPSPATEIKGGEVADGELTQEPATFNESASTGISQHVHEERAGAGKLGTIEPGEGVSPEEMINRGRQLVADGADPEAVSARIAETKQVSSDDIAVLRARMEELSKATNVAEDALSKDPGNPELKANYEEAYKAETDWAQNHVKPAQTEWHKSGMAMQGSTDIDTGTFSGLRRAFRDERGRDATPAEQEKLRQIADKNQGIDNEISIAKDVYDKTLEAEAAKAGGKRLPVDVDSLREHFAARLKTLLPCEV